MDLDWKQIKIIVSIADILLSEISDIDNPPEWVKSEEAYYTKVLEKFNEINKDINERS